MGCDRSLNTIFGVNAYYFDPSVLFQVYDTDGDGFLSRTELSKMLADHVDMKVLEPDADDAQHAATRLYTWLVYL